jgi:hypothetical protein
MPLVIQAISIAMWLNRRLAAIEVVVSECESARSAPNRRPRLTPRIASSANVTLIVPSLLTIRCRLVGYAWWLSRLAR